MQEKIEQLKNKINLMKNKYNKDLGTLHSYEETRTELEGTLNNLNKEQEEYQTKILIIEEACKEARENAKVVLEDVCTSAIKMALGEHLSVKIDFGKKGNSSTADISVLSTYGDSIVEVDPAEEDGGGSADIVALSSFWSIGELVADKDNKAPVFLDEPTKYVSKGNSEKVSQYIKEMVEFSEKQTFFITHDDFVKHIGDVAYTFALDADGVTKVMDVTCN